MGRKGWLKLVMAKHIQVIMRHLHQVQNEPRTITRICILVTFRQMQFPPPGCPTPPFTGSSNAFFDYPSFWEILAEYSVGVSPNSFLKLLLKYDWSLKPTA